MEGARLPHHQYPRLQWYLYPDLVDQGCASRCPTRSAFASPWRELGRRLHEGIDWWDRQLAEYRPLPEFRHFSPPHQARGDRQPWAGATILPFWLLTARSMQYSWGGNVACRWCDEVAAEREAATAA